MEKEIKDVSMGFILDLESTLNYLAENKEYIAQINNIKLKFVGDTEDEKKGKRQIFEIEREIK